jgi:hypothetical protein
MNDFEVAPTGEPIVPVVAFLIPTYKTPYLTSDLLSAALACGKFVGCTFVLLLDKEDPHILTYKTLVENVREKGLSAGFFVFDGTPYCGKINRVAPIVSAECLCVLDSRHLPMIDGVASFAEGVRSWLALSPEPMRVGTFTEECFFPLVTRKLVDRLGYMFHPLSYGRVEAENWLLTLSSAVGILSSVAGGKIIESSADGVEIVGTSDPEDSRWVDEILDQTVDEEAERLTGYLLR